MLFWSEIGSQARLMSVKTDGTEQKVLLSDSNYLGTNPIALAYRPEGIANTSKYNNT